MPHAIHISAAQLATARRALSAQVEALVLAETSDPQRAKNAAADARLAVDFVTSALEAVMAGDFAALVGRLGVGGDFVRDAHAAARGLPDRHAPAADRVEAREANIAAVELADETPRHVRMGEHGRGPGARVIVSYRGEEGEPLLTIAGPAEAQSHHDAEHFARTHFVEGLSAQAREGISGFRIEWRD